MNIEGKNEVLKIKPGPNNPRNSEGAFLELKNGQIIFIYTHFVGDSASDNDPASLAKRVSNNGGVTWSGEEIIMKRDGGLNLMSVSLLRLRNGNIALFYLRKNSLSDCIPMMRVSTNEAKSWGQPEPVIKDRKGYFVVNNDRVVQLDSGRILMPVSLFKTPGTVWSNKGRLWCYISDDEGLNWTASEEIPNLDSTIFQEPGVVELKDGRIMMFIRTDAGFQYFSFSKDGGETWSAARPGNIPSPLSSASIKRIPSTGDLLLVWNNNGGEDDTIVGKRTPLNTAVSADEGETWENIRTIHDDRDGWYSYVAIHFTGQKVLLGYCAGKNSRFNIEKSMETGAGLSVTSITILDFGCIYRKYTKNTTLDFQ